MASSVAITLNGGPIHAQVRILRQHIGNTAIDLWHDADGNGRPDQFFKRVKPPNESENALVLLDVPSALKGKIVQWIWQPSQPPGENEDWKVSIDLRQGDQSLPGFPRELEGEYPEQKWGLYQTWVKLV